MVDVVLPALAVAACSSPDQPSSNASHVLTGAVLGGAGKPVVGASITLDPGGRSAVTDGSGRFSVGGLEPGSYRVAAARDGFSTESGFLISRDTTDVLMRLGIWKPVWADEFDGAALDSGEWTWYTGESGVPGEDVYYTMENVEVRDGILRMKVDRRPMGTVGHTGASIFTQKLWMNGRFEIRARVPAGRGLWFAHWLWPSQHSTPEIDIMELLGRDPGTIYGTYHYTDSTGERRRKQIPHGGADFSAVFHTFAVEWFPGEGRWFVDGREYFRASFPQADREMRLMLTNQVGGSWAGMPDSTTLFPQFHEIDFVRIYRPAE